MSALYHTFYNEMVLRGFSERTMKSYTANVKKMVRYFNMSPVHLKEEHIREYLLYLTKEKKLKPASTNQVLSAIIFLYSHVLKDNSFIHAIPFRKREKHLPVFLNREEITRLFNAAVNMKHRALLMTAYGTGARSTELVNLKVSDIDSKEMVVRIDQGKGKKDRFTKLPDTLLLMLREYFKWYQPRTFLFYSDHFSSHLASGTASRIFRTAKKKAGILKKGGIHTLRHSFATHMLEKGTDLRTLQLMMGHNQLSTTAIYLHVATSNIKYLSSPFDDLDLDYPSKTEEEPCPLL